MTMYQQHPKLNLNNVSTERLNWRPMLRQMRQSTIRQTLHLHFASNTKIDSVIWLVQTMFCVMKLRIYSPIFFGQNAISDFPTNVVVVDTSIADDI